jgi:2-oxo-4-hydroxy-4-carboxy--5-ureidoimidazoline (OHCU) decarboxylase
VTNKQSLSHTVDQEVDAALAQVFDITRMRLERLLGAVP